MQAAATPPPTVDGATWNTTNLGGAINSIAYFNSKYIAATPVGIQYSSDGVSWTAATMSGGTLPFIVFSLAASSTEIVAFGNYTFNQTTLAYESGVAYSSDGITWTKVAFSTFNYTSFNKSIYTGSFFLACSGTLIIKSTDGINWSAYTSGSFSFSSYMQPALLSSTIYMPYSSTQYLTTTDGISWTAYSYTSAPGFTPAYFSVTNGILFGTQYYAGSSYITYNGTTWTTHAPTGVTSSTYELGAVLYNSGTGLYYFANGQDGIYSSSTAVSSTTPAFSLVSGLPSSTSGINYINSKYVIVSGAGSLYTSTQVNTGYTVSSFRETHRGVIYSSTRGKWFATTATVIRSSSDGITWATVFTFPGNALTIGNQIAELSGVIIVTYTGGAYYRSTDGTTWTQYTTPALQNIFAANGYFIGYYNGAFSRSTDGISWTSGTNIPIGSPGGIYYNANNSTYYCSSITGNNGSLVQSSDGINWINSPGIPTFSTRPAFTGTSGTSSIYVGCMFGEIYTKQISSSTWTSALKVGTTLGPAQGSVTFNDIFVDSSGYIYGSSNSGLVYSTNSGSTWTVVSSTGITGNQIGKIVQFSTGPLLTTIQTTANNCLYVSNSARTSWSKVTTSGLPSTSINSTNMTIAINPSTNTLVMVVSGNLYYCTDGAGATWTAATNPNSGTTYDSVKWVAGASKFVVFAKLTGYTTILVSSDGITWTSNTLGASYSIVDVEYYAAYVTSSYTGMFAIDSNGALYKQNTSNTWPFIGWYISGVVNPFQQIGGMTTNNSIIYFAGNGVWITSSDGSTATGWTLNRSQYFAGAPGTAYMYASNLYGGDLVTSNNGTSWTNNVPGNRYTGVIGTNRNIIAVGPSNNETIYTATSSYSLNTMNKATILNGSVATNSYPGQTVFAANTVSSGGRIVYAGASGYLAYTTIK